MCLDGLNHGCVVGELDGGDAHRARWLGCFASELDAGHTDEEIIILRPFTMVDLLVLELGGHSASHGEEQGPLPTPQGHAKLGAGRHRLSSHGRR